MEDNNTSIVVAIVICLTAIAVAAYCGHRHLKKLVATGKAKRDARRAAESGNSA